MARNSAAAKTRAGWEFIFPTPLFLPAPPERFVLVSAARSAAINRDFAQNRFALRSVIATKQYAFMKELLKYTYLMEVDKIGAELEKLWDRYQDILSNPDWEKLNEARAILFLIGNVYCEKIVPEAIERRLHLLNKPMSLVEFLSEVDGRSINLPTLREDPLFSQLEKFYLIVKEFKNKNVGGKYYIDEEKFIELYNQYNPNKKLKTGYRGRFG